MPAFAVAGKPRFLGWRRNTMRPRSANACNASTNSVSGEASSTTMQRAPAGSEASTLSMQASVCSQPR